MTSVCEDEDGGLTSGAADPVLRACGRTPTSVFAANLHWAKKESALEAHLCVRDLMTRRCTAAPVASSHRGESMHHY
ncbi:hypothetical protein NDU88_006045 [Pleurodeles waltl]|uniref:Uncharacterized protein n=1 Tax=Pleurodeles waltl TaxID=8319 RepID=A0AAV7N053_PLEWA|nr:hypothetical protein NDU88_006045 [Pleurodeles waltl]